MPLAREHVEREATQVVWIQTGEWELSGERGKTAASAALWSSEGGELSISGRVALERPAAGPFLSFTGARVVAFEQRLTQPLPPALNQL